MQYHLNVDIGFNGIVTDIPMVKSMHVATDFSKLPGPFFVPCQYLRQDVIDFLAALDIQVHKVHGIRLEPDNSPPPHCDDPGPGDWARLMWWEGRHTDMTWYKLNEGIPITKLHRPMDDATHYIANFEQVSEIHRVRLSASNPVLVRTGTLHSGFNYEDQPCFGWQIWPTRGGHSVTFDQLADALAPYVLD
jgi:hypothetical protein